MHAPLLSLWRAGKTDFQVLCAVFLWYRNWAKQQIVILLICLQIRFSKREQTAMSFQLIRTVTNCDQSQKAFSFSAVCKERKKGAGSTQRTPWQLLVTNRFCSWHLNAVSGLPKIISSSVSHWQLQDT